MMQPDRRQVLLGSAAIGAGAMLRSLRASAAPVSTDDPGPVTWIVLPNGNKVWTQRLGSGEKKVLLVNGGPGLSHDYMQCFASFLPQAGYALYFYDQLGTGASDRPDDRSLWTLPRYLDELETVRAGLGLERFVLIGHSWGAILGIEYALRHPERLSGFVLSNMSASFADYGAYWRHLRDTLPEDVRMRLTALEAAGLGDSEAYADLVQRELYSRYICRLDPWPSPIQRSLSGLNTDIYRQLQGPNEFTPTGELKEWDRWADLHRIATPTLVIGARYDEMNPESARREARLIPNAELFLSDTGSHLAMWDDQVNYFKAVLGFLSRLPS
ncbi:proline iminopeptidase-family hydrolase [Methylobacterium sp. ARG-1]|uniref:proline iminopeptidase-family hydrolase n=1 Tax=Methylobacterium sp. ARG-1 TaxID=1692501 RepID=UPI000A4F5429|nr:proline iminopeptidase-family hydrolase [Methylobacterium sp. ARG-1]